MTPHGETELLDMQLAENSLALIRRSFRMMGVVTLYIQPELVSTHDGARYLQQNLSHCSHFGKG